jgi:hypothetical protein
MDINLDTLVLLIGTNPLPNLVVAEYFINKNNNLKNIFFIYSEENSNQKGTKKYCENLEKIIKLRHGRDLTFNYIALSDVGNAKEIKRDMEKSLLDRIKKYSIENIHLNYTGGTKVMGIHTYNWFKEREKNVSFSYLDARNFRLRDDEEGIVTSDLRKEIKLRLDDIITLHGFRRINNDEEFKFTESLSKFKELIEQDKLPEFYEKYKRDLFLNKKGELIKKISEVKDELKNMKAEEPLLSIVLALPEDYRIFNPDGSFRELETNRCLEDAVGFIDGKWLEQYVYETLKSHFNNLDIYCNYEIKKSDWSGNQRFELDVIIIKGYQLIGISCTTSDKKYICKSKGFEIIHRTRQIGGEEARAILITRLKDETRDDLDNELSIDTGGKDNILVLGDSDLKQERLIEKINKFIE